MKSHEPNFYSIRTAHKRFGTDTVEKAQRLIRKGTSFKTIQRETGIPIGTLRFIKNDLEAQDESREAVRAGCEYIVTDCKSILMSACIKLTEHGGSYHLNGRPASIGEVISKANQVLADNGMPGNLGKNPEWHR